MITLEGSWGLGSSIVSGEVTPANYNASWVGLKEQYQGIVPPVERPAGAFDAGAKYHIPASVPYTRYFLARILQFQFYKAACDQAGWTGPLHRCSFYGNAQVGEKLNAMLEMGASKPWPDALEAFEPVRELLLDPRHRLADDVEHGHADDQRREQYRRGGKRGDPEHPVGERETGVHVEGTVFGVAALLHARHARSQRCQGLCRGVTRLTRRQVVDRVRAVIRLVHTQHHIAEAHDQRCKGWIQ